MSEALADLRTERECKSQRGEPRTHKLVDRQGVEPHLAGYKPAALPLHQRSVVTRINRRASVLAETVSADRTRPISRA